MEEDSVLAEKVGGALRHMADAAPFLAPALWLAVLRGATEEARQLLAGGANVDERGGPAPHLATPLQIAVSRMNVEVAQLLLDHGAVVSARDNTGRAALHSASIGAVALLLLQHGADVSATDTDGWAPLHLAALHGHEDVVQVLIEHRANVLAETNDGVTAEGLAASRSHLEVVAMLKAAAVTRAKCVAFAMGHHTRLGVGSRVEGLDPEVIRMVLERV